MAAMNPGLFPTAFSSERGIPSNRLPVPSAVSVTLGEAFQEMVKDMPASGNGVRQVPTPARISIG